MPKKNDLAWIEFEKGSTEIETAVPTFFYRGALLCEIINATQHKHVMDEFVKPDIIESKKRGGTPATTADVDQDGMAKHLMKYIKGYAFMPIFKECTREEYEELPQDKRYPENVNDFTDMFYRVDRTGKCIDGKDSEFSRRQLGEWVNQYLAMFINTLFLRNSEMANMAEAIQFESEIKN